MTQIFLTFLIFIFGTATFLAADKTSQKPADNKKEESAEKEKDEKKIPIRITSDKMKYHENGFIVFFTGNVNVDDGEMKLNCDFMTVNLDKTRNPVKIICEKNVVIRKQNSTSHSDRAEYYVPEEKVTLTGSPKVVSVNTKGEKQTFTGEKIDFFRSNNEIVTYGGTVEFGAPPKKTEEKEKK